MKQYQVNKQAIILVGVLSLVSLFAYLIASLRTYRLGFPLDDAWIHQTYARNLVVYREWAFLPGEPSAGSTSPLWTVLLAIGHLLGIKPVWWSALLGVVTLAGMALLARAVVSSLLPARPFWANLASLLVLFEWHLVWAAGSGMETALYACLSLSVVFLLATNSPRWLFVGLIVGLAVWVRPDGITLLGMALWVMFFRRSLLRGRVDSLARFFIGFILVFLPYLIFNRWLGDSWWPNTYFAKQAEYTVELAEPFWSRLLEQVGQLFVGIGVILLPGFAIYIIQQVRTRRFDLLAGALWVLGYLCLYALRLPVTYQHGRYIIPAMAVYFVLGWVGMASWSRLQAADLWRRVVSRTALITAAVVLIAFWILGMRAFARDVAFIESEMVETARWIQKNSLPSELIAAHDIGALGYFVGRPLIDLAGLVSPEVIPFIRDEQRIAAYLDARRADYLVTFPGWYPELTSGRKPIFITGGAFAPADGYENMAVFRWLTNP